VDGVGPIDGPGKKRDRGGSDEGAPVGRPTRRAKGKRGSNVGTLQSSRGGSRGGAFRLRKATTGS